MCLRYFSAPLLLLWIFIALFERITTQSGTQLSAIEARVYAALRDVQNSRARARTRDLSETRSRTRLFSPSFARNEGDARFFGRLFGSRETSAGRRTCNAHRGECFERGPNLNLSRRRESRPGLTQSLAVEYECIEKYGVTVRPTEEKRIAVT